MRILIVQPWIQLGGAEIISIQLANHLQVLGHDVAIVCAFVDLEGMPEEKSTLRFIVPCNLLQSLCRRSRFLFLLLVPWILLLLTWKHAQFVDILNPHNFPSLWTSIIVGKVRRKIVVWTCNEPPERISFKRALNLGIGDFFGWLVASSWIDKIMVGLADEIYVPSYKTRQDVIERYGKSPKIVPLGVDYEFYRKGDRSLCRSKMDLNGHFVLLVVGKLHPQKNQGICINALKLILHRIPQAILLLAGNGPMEDKYRIQARELCISDKTRFLGMVDSFTIRDLYAGCDINLFPAVNQSWGLTPFEALSAGRLSIVSRDTGAAEFISKHEIGIVCDPTPKYFSEAILRFHEDPDPYEKSVDKGRSLVQETLTWNQYTERVIEIFSSAGGGNV